MLHPWNTVRYGAFLVREILAGTGRTARYALSGRARGKLAIVEYEMRCATDLEITWFASSITITPGTLVVGMAPGTSAAPATLFVHSMFDNDRTSVVEGLRDMENRLLRMTRGSAENAAPGTGGAA
ncbi:Na+/H+ antiporter subunit E [Zhihengliuella halotolerans]|uniref:Multicomponent Na+:H+ antiporter subunit E n=1 Tax=Zhihengliuella halotolerans TaxID=370736 RepID=A0A4Q8AGV4_9MICC|nr:Na+/H+ antiporter subunit E [Zhihengliuella halotolerans]RZU62963.1 multicomponent Na+:H+ antiporter subunit E [Zhihengliuella halotolerans]